MKTSFFLLTVLILNSTLLLAKPLTTIVKDVNLWIFIAIEVVLIFALALHRYIKILGKAYEIDFGQLDVFVFRDSNK